jgi:hypothetical protein
VNNDSQVQEFFPEYFFLKHDGFFPSSLNHFSETITESFSTWETNFNWKEVELGSILVARKEDNMIVMHDQRGNASLKFNFMKKDWKFTPRNNVLIVFCKVSDVELLVKTKGVLPDMNFLLKLTEEEMVNFLKVYQPYRENFCWTKPIIQKTNKTVVWMNHTTLKAVVDICNKYGTTEIEKLLEIAGAKKSIEYWIDSQNLEIRNESGPKKTVSSLIVDNILDKALASIIQNPYQQPPKSVLNLIIQNIFSTRNLLLSASYSTEPIKENSKSYLFNKQQFRSDCSISIVYEDKTIILETYRGEIATTKIQAEHNVASTILRDIENLLNEATRASTKNAILDEFFPNF